MRMLRLTFLSFPLSPPPPRIQKNFLRMIRMHHPITHIMLQITYNRIILHQS
jgi:hypothetical protein